MHRFPASVIGLLAVSMLVIFLGYQSGRGTEPPPPSGAQATPQPAATVQQAQAATPVQPPPPATVPPTAAPQQPPSPDQAPTTPTPTRTLGSLLGAVGGGASSAELSPARAEQAATPSANVVSGGEVAQTLAATDAGDLFKKSPAALGVENQFRSPIANETRVRGEHLGQVYTQADGAFWFPARQDLDTFLSKTDASLIQNAIIIKGPYSAFYGPAFSFIDIQTLGTPRYQHGFEWHGDALSTYQFNGEQLSGRASLWGGDYNYGFRVSYGQRTGAPYTSGNDTSMPAQYDSRDLVFDLGYDLTPKDHLEFGYFRLDQTDLGFPGQIFDTDFLISNAYRLRYVGEDKELVDRLLIEGYYNRTSLHGNAQEPGKRTQIPVLDTIDFVGFTQVYQSSAGYRVAGTWGHEKEPQLTIGQDLRFQSQALNEFDTELGLTPICGNINFPIPPNQQYDIGFFSEYLYPVNDCLQLRTGGRIDYINSDIVAIPPGFPCPDHFQVIANSEFFNLTGNNIPTTGDFERDMTLMMAFGTAEYKINENWTYTSGLGFAQRPPTVTELYAMQSFLAILQQGFTAVVGNPDLASEKLYQIDMGLKTNYDRFRAGLNGYCAFIQDYITVEPVVSDPNAPFGRQGSLVFSPQLTNSLEVQFTNTGLATLIGFETYAEYDVTSWLTPFMTMYYVEGRNLNRDQQTHVTPPPGTPVPIGFQAPPSSQEPLPGIPPLETRLGLRFHESVQDPRYGVEFYALVEAPQDQVAASLGEVKTPGFTIFNIRGYWRVRKNVLVTAGIENMFDRNYRQHLDLLTGVLAPGSTAPSGPGVLEPGISPYLGLQVTW
jgi:outer membrane receptor protein involved in Fe transport